MVGGEGTGVVFLGLAGNQCSGGEDRGGCTEAEGREGRGFGPRSSFDPATEGVAGSGARRLSRAHPRTVGEGLRRAGGAEKTKRFPGGGQGLSGGSGFTPGTTERGGRAGRSLFVAQSCPTLANPWTVVCQAPLSMGFSRQEYWSGLPFPSPGDLPNPGNRIHVSCIACRFFTN